MNILTRSTSFVWTQYLVVLRTKAVPPAWLGSKPPSSVRAASSPDRIAARVSESDLMMSLILSRTKVWDWILSRYGSRNGQVLSLSCFFRIFEKAM